MGHRPIHDSWDLFMEMRQGNRVFKVDPQTTFMVPFMSHNYPSKSFVPKILATRNAPYI